MTTKHPSSSLIFLLTIGQKTYGISKEYDKISKVFIPKKTEKKGERFGFARIERVADSRVFALKLDEIFIGTYKLMVNAPRFSRGS